MPPVTVRTYSVTAPVTPTRFVLLTDLHNRAEATLAQQILALRPDAVLIAGDLFECPPRRRYTRFSEATALLLALRGVPVFYAGGNHDYRLPSELARVMRECDVTPLLDDSVSFRGMLLGGLNSAQYEKEKTPNLAFLNEYAGKTGYKILLCHHPEYYPRYIRDLPIDLTLSGHAHGGQWTLFGRGVYAPGQGLFPRYCAGLYEGRLLVSRGLKVSRPIPRIGNPRELVLLTLSPAAETETSD